MANNIEHTANYSVKTSFGPCPNGFKRTSGPINTLAHRASRLIRTPLNNPMNMRFNALVNSMVEAGNEWGLAQLEKLNQSSL